VTRAPRMVPEIDPAALAAFEAEMSRRAVDLNLYNLMFFATDELFIVATSYKEKPRGLRGSVPGFPDYEVKILRSDNSVQSVSMAR
jgi:hypothetical protein